MESPIVIGTFRPFPVLSLDEQTRRHLSSLQASISPMPIVYCRGELPCAVQWEAGSLELAYGLG